MIQNSSRNSPIFTSRRCGRYRCWLAAGTLPAAVVVARSVEQAEGEVAPPGAPAGLIFLGFSLPQNRAQLVRQVARGVLVLAEHVTVGLRVVEGGVFRFAPAQGGARQPATISRSRLARYELAIVQAGMFGVVELQGFQAGIG